MTPTLSYCMNVHPGESLSDLLALLAGPARRVREAHRGDAALGAGLWLPLGCARDIAEDEASADRVREALATANLFAFTVNAFPIGGFHAARVKQEVYRPDWTRDERLDYTLLACRALARLLPEGARGSVSTVPVAFKGHLAKGDDDLALAGRNLGRAALALSRLETETGHEIALALEPEPLAVLETTPEAIAFLETHVFGGAARDALVEAGETAERAEATLRRFVGVCVDACHLACEFEHLPTALGDLAAAGVRVVKAQLSTALELARPASDPVGLARLLAFDEPRYLHQSIGCLPSGGLVRAADLPDLAQEGALVPEFRDVEVLRTHFHVPLSWEGDGVLRTTRPTLEEGLLALAAATDHLEVETYTFGVLPQEQREAFGGDVVNMICAELAWAEESLIQGGLRPV